MDYAKESLRLHGEWKGKIEVKATVPVETKDDLSLAYTPGVYASERSSFVPTGTVAFTSILPFHSPCRRSDSFA